MSDLIQALLAFSLPPISERERYTFQTAPLVLVSTFPLLLASYLRLRRPHFPFLAKLVILLAGLPIVSHFLLKRYYVAVWYDTFDNTPYSLNHLNFVCGMAIGFIALKHIELLFLEKDSDFEVKGWEEYSKEQGNGVRSSASPSEPYTLRRPALFPGLTVPLEVDLVMSIRGQGYNWGAKKSTGGYKAMVQSQQLEKNPKLASEYKWSHIRRIGLSAVTNVVLMDLCDSIIKDTRIFPPAGRMGGGPIAEAANGGLGQLGPIIITVATGVLIFVALQANYSLGYLAHVAITPAYRIPIIVGKWDPLPFNRPYAATSLGTFWSKHWHSFVRRTFTVFAYKPVLRISDKFKVPGRLAQTFALVATFALSGLLHEGCLEGQVSYFYDRRLQLEHSHLNLEEATKETQKEYGFGAKGFATTYAFTIQAFFVMLEAIWLSTVEPQVVKWTTGHKGTIVEGRLRAFIGWVWTFSCMIYSGYYISDVWHSHGLTNATASLRLFHRASRFLQQHM